MPILDVEIVLHPNESLNPGLATELAHRAGDIFGSSPGGTWVKVHTLPGDQYAENSDPPNDVYPVFVTILKSKLPTREVMQTEVTKVTQVIAQVCGRPAQNVHIIYLPAGAGRVAFGGDLVAP